MEPSLRSFVSLDGEVQPQASVLPFSEGEEPVLSIWTWKGSDLGL